MSIYQTKWTDSNRFNQPGYSSPTIFPVKSDYTNLDFFKEDLSLAKKREEIHREFLDDLRREHLRDQYCIDNNIDCNDVGDIGWL